MNDRLNWRDLGTILRGTDPTVSNMPPLVSILPQGRICDLANVERGDYNVFVRIRVRLNGSVFVAVHTQGGEVRMNGPNDQGACY